MSPSRLQKAGWRRDLYTSNIELGGVKLAVRTEAHADQWYCRPGRINSRCLDLLNKTEPQQIGVSEGDRRTPAGITKCQLEDSGLPNFLSGKLPFVGLYLGNRTLICLRTVGCRTFVHIETRTEKLEDRS